MDDSLTFADVAASDVKLHESSDDENERDQRENKTIVRVQTFFLLSVRTSLLVVENCSA